MCFYTIEKKYTRANIEDKYVSDTKDNTKWCEKCVSFGEMAGNRNWLCCAHYPQIAEVSFCGHCNKFSTDKKINALKYALLLIEGFEFRNKAR